MAYTPKKNIFFCFFFCFSLFQTFWQGYQAKNPFSYFFALLIALTGKWSLRGPPTFFDQKSTF